MKIIEKTKKISLPDKYECFLISGVLVYFIVFSFLALSRHWSYQSFMLDMANFDQCLWTTLHGSFFYTSVTANIGLSIFGIHNTPILFVVLPFYSLFPSAEVLIIIQCFVLALAAIPLFSLAKEHVGNKGALTITTAYFLYAPLHGVILSDFHELAFAPLILFTCFYFFFKKEMKWFVITCCFALMIREEFVLIIIMIAFYGLIKKDLFTNEKDRLVLALIILLAAFWLMVSLVVIIPFFNPVHRYLPISGHFGGNTITDLVTVQPVLKSIYLFELFFPLGFLSVLSPGILSTAAPALTEILFSKFMLYQISEWYPALVIPSIFVACIFGIKSLLARCSRTGFWNENRIYAYILVSSVMSFLVFTPSPLSPVSIYRADYTITQHHKVLDDAVNLIPPAASVSTQNDIGSHLAHRFELYTDYRSGVEYIMIDKRTISIWRSVEPNLLRYLDKYDKIFSKNGVELYKIKK